MTLSLNYPYGVNGGEPIFFGGVSLTLLTLSSLITLNWGGPFFLVGGLFNTANTHNAHNTNYTTDYNLDR